MAAYQRHDQSLIVGAHARQIGAAGWIDELRITKGVARYVAPFSPPTAAFSDGGCS